LTTFIFYVKESKFIYKKKAAAGQAKMPAGITAMREKE